jgi:hypothetical protein
MRLPEQRLYDWFQRTLGAAAFIERVENRVKRDTPDLYIAEATRHLRGWVELKVLPEWPVRATTPVRLAHWTTGQRYWANRHSLHGGQCWLLVWIEGEVFVFNAATAAMSMDWTRAEWHEFGQVVEVRNARAVDLLDALARCVV